MQLRQEVAVIQPVKLVSRNCRVIRRIALTRKGQVTMIKLLQASGIHPNVHSSRWRGRLSIHSTWFKSLVFYHPLERRVTRMEYMMVPSYGVYRVSWSAWQPLGPKPALHYGLDGIKIRKKLWSLSTAKLLIIWWRRICHGWDFRGNGCQYDSFHAYVK